ncbi:hypothetical protein MCR_0334 [Moraxella catarrhalis BBH18]|nr:hypothetical protein MCR_0334 [Moraxella catarrhalis BBH18]
MKPNKSECSSVKCNSINIRCMSIKSTQRSKNPKAHQLGGVS